MDRIDRNGEEFGSTIRSLTIDGRRRGLAESMKYFQSPKKIVDGSMVEVGWSVKCQTILVKSMFFEIKQEESHRWSMHRWFGVDRSRRGVQVVQENWSMVDGGKRMMTCHHPHVSCHINIHVSCHVTQVDTSG
jgi:hypothetical protein